MFDSTNFRWSRPFALLAAGAAVFAALSLAHPVPTHSTDSEASQAAARMLLKCRAQGKSVEQCRALFAKAQLRAKKDYARTMLTKCRLAGHSRQRCEAMISTAMTDPKTEAVNDVKRYCLHNNIKTHRCRALIAERIGGGGLSSQRMLARCKSVGLNELECKKRMDFAERKLGQ